MNINQLQLISLPTILSVIIAGLVIGRLYVYRSLPHEVAGARLYTMGVLNASFAVLLYFSHTIANHEIFEVDDQTLWVEALLLNIVFLLAVYFGQRKWRG